MRPQQVHLLQILFLNAKINFVSNKQSFISQRILKSIRYGRCTGVRIYGTDIGVFVIP